MADETFSETNELIRKNEIMDQTQMCDNCSNSTDEYANDVYIDSTLDFKLNDELLQTDEELLIEQQRYTVYPIKYPKIWDMYVKQRSCFWIPGEIDFSEDKNDWNKKLTENERYFVKHILAFFAGSDGIVNVNILENFSKEVKILEAQMAYLMQGAIEGIHAETYSLMIDIYIDDENEKHSLFNAIEKIPCIAKKAEWALKWTKRTKERSFAKRLVAFAIVEGLFFSGAFCAIYWLKEKAILPGLTKSNEFIARDERLHTEFACLLYSMVKNKPSQSEIYQMIDEAVEIEIEFITESLPVHLLGMNAELMIQYIRFVADWLLTHLNYPKKYNTTNPFIFMQNIGLESRSNFFDERTSTYQKNNDLSMDLEANNDF